MNANELEKMSAVQVLHAQATFDASVDHIDADTLRRLRDARSYALRPTAKGQRPMWALPIGAAFATAFALVLLWPNASPPVSAPIHATDANAIMAAAAQTHVGSDVAEDASVDNALADSLPGDSTDGADPELLGNLDFYGWLAKQPVLTRGGG